MRRQTTYSSSDTLTERESEVIFLLCKGLKNEEIAEELNISTHTVKAHLESIYEKLAVFNRVQASIKAVKMGYIKLETVVE